MWFLFSELVMTLLHQNTAQLGLASLLLCAASWRALNKVHPFLELARISRPEGRTTVNHISDTSKEPNGTSPPDFPRRRQHQLCSRSSEFPDTVGRVVPGPQRERIRSGLCEGIIYLCLSFLFKVTVGRGNMDESAAAEVQIQSVFRNSALSQGDLCQSHTLEEVCVFSVFQKRKAVSFGGERFPRASETSWSVLLLPQQRRLKAPRGGPEPKVAVGRMRSGSRWNILLKRCKKSGRRALICSSASGQKLCLCCFPDT